MLAILMLLLLLLLLATIDWIAHCHELGGRQLRLSKMILYRGGRGRGGPRLSMRLVVYRAVESLKARFRRILSVVNKCATPCFRLIMMMMMVGRTRIGGHRWPPVTTSGPKHPGMTC
jgi:hypothetical protein